MKELLLSWVEHNGQHGQHVLVFDLVISWVSSFRSLASEARMRRMQRMALPSIHRFLVEIDTEMESEIDEIDEEISNGKDGGAWTQADFAVDKTMFQPQINSLVGIPP